MKMENTKQLKHHESQKNANNANQPEAQRDVISIVICTENYRVEIEID